MHSFHCFTEEALLIVHSGTKKHANAFSNQLLKNFYFVNLEKQNKPMYIMKHPLIVKQHKVK